MTDTSQWSSVKPYSKPADAASWIPKEDQDRIAAYLKYDQMYWNDSNQYALRVLEGETPLYIPNARTIVDTTSYYLLKGMTLTCDNKATQTALDDFLDREEFYSRFDEAKVSGVARGDFFFHMTADPRKPEGQRISLVPVEPMNVFPIWDEDQPDHMVGCHIATAWVDPDDNQQRTRIRRLTYRIVESEVGVRRISREEAIYEVDPNWWGPKAKLVKQILRVGLLDNRITALPIYWFANKKWLGEDYGSSELRGIEVLTELVSQGSTDVSASLALEGLGVYATDGGRPVDETGNEVDWEVAPGRVMEVPAGSYFRRVEGVGSITPAVDQINYLEDKMHEAAGLNDVALGTADPATAASGIALAIKFAPTLAKIESRDRSGISKLKQLFFDWKTWYAVFERVTLEGDIVPSIGDKLPIDRVARVNELNNMVDRGLIPAQFYRDEMMKLGYKFPKDIEKQLEDEAQKKIDNARAAFLATAPNGAGNGDTTSSDDETSSDGNTLPTAGNKSNNASKPNESAGTESTQKSQ
jgi:hypothetical protein